jgi:1-aminocyclopropane-1-carboxylate deaminase/D-cysteine desulfhydrase-like pyridoxal-dependent ACC family enzyme
MSREAGGGELFVKRDDKTGLSFGGNKVRQLEFYLGEALAQSADAVLITGAVQSNFVRSVAAAACRLGLECHAQLEERVATDEPVYHTSGNPLLNIMLGAKIYPYPEGEDEAGADARLEEIADGLREKGKHPYVIHLGADNPQLGALGYVLAAQEILGQIAEQNLTFDEIVVASGCGSTHAGLLFGLRALGCGVRVTGFCVRREAPAQIERIRGHLKNIAGLLELSNPVPDEDIHIIDAFLAPGYGRLNPAAIEAIRLAARAEALILDPVYTAKSMAGPSRGPVSPAAHGASSSSTPAASPPSSDTAPKSPKTSEAESNQPCRRPKPYPRNSCQKNPLLLGRNAVKCIKWPK